MSIRSLRTFGLVSAIGGGFALVVVLCLGVALVWSIAPVSHGSRRVQVVCYPVCDIRRCRHTHVWNLLGRPCPHIRRLPSTENPVPRLHAAIDPKPCTHRHAAFG